MGDVVARFEIARERFLDPSGTPVQELPGFARDREALIGLYRAMWLARSFDAKAIMLQRTGQIGTYASILGQEAVGAGLAAAMRPEDVLFPSYRETAAQLVRGVRMAEILLYWGGDERGSDFRAARADFPNCVPVASQACHAAGAATAFRLREEARVAVCVHGDGGTSKGDFYESINLAGTWRLPAVFVVNNNQWAISVPRAAQTGAETIAQKAIAAGIPGIQVDGNDVVAVRQIVGAAIERARAGGGATLVEALTYRLGDHTTADDASRYRADDEVARHWQEEPLVRLRQHLAKAHAWSKADEETLRAECEAEVEAAVREFHDTPAPAPESMFDHLYAALPEALAPQREAVRRRGSDHG